MGISSLPLYRLQGPLQEQGQGHLEDPHTPQGLIALTILETVAGGQGAPLLQVGHSVNLGV